MDDKDYWGLSLPLFLHLETKKSKLWENIEKQIIYPRALLEASREVQEIEYFYLKYEVQIGSNKEIILCY